MLLRKKPGAGRLGALSVVLTFLIAVAGPTSTHSFAQIDGGVPDADEAVTASSSWLEPRGIAIIELVGQVPDRYLEGTILSHDDGEGIVVYESGSRVGDSVIVTTSIYPRVTSPAWTPLLTSFGCIGEEPHYDHMGTVVPESVLRVYADNGVEVTHQILNMDLTPMARLQPSAGSSQAFRYPTYSYGPGKTYPLPLESDGLHIPSNSGCRIRIPDADYEHLTGVFSLELDHSVTASVVGVQQAPFKSYIGPGEVGIFQPLMDQLKAAFGSRAFRVALDLPEGASHFLLRFPAMPADPYTDRNIGYPYPNADRPVSGTYRLWRPVHELSTNMNVSAAFPVTEAWRDADQAPGTEFLPLMPSPTELAAPEYLLPAGITYQVCFTTGTCSREVLEQIYNTSMTLEIVYLSIRNPRLDGEWIRLEMAGPLWTATASQTAATEAGFDSLTRVDYLSLGIRDVPPDDYKVYLPFVSVDIQEVPTGCPCGWFDAMGRMLGFWP